MTHVQRRRGHDVVPECRSVMTPSPLAIAGGVSKEKSTPAGKAGASG